MIKNKFRKVLLKYNVSHWITKGQSQIKECWESTPAMYNTCKNALKSLISANKKDTKYICVKKFTKSFLSQRNPSDRLNCSLQNIINNNINNAFNHCFENYVIKNGFINGLSTIAQHKYICWLSKVTCLRFYDLFFCFIAFFRESDLFDFLSSRGFTVLRPKFI